MSSRDPLDPALMLSAYAQGAFPMTDADGIVRWYSADPRGVFPLDAFHIPKTLRALLRREPPAFDVRVNTAFEQTVRACADARPDRTWIGEELIAAYVRLHRRGHAHSVETWRDGRLVGGLYGITIGGAFLGESMFHTVTDASKVALVSLVSRLRERGYALLDAQACTPHLRKFGCVEMPEDQYLELLGQAAKLERQFT